MKDILILVVRLIIAVIQQIMVLMLMLAVLFSYMIMIIAIGIYWHWIVALLLATAAVLTSEARGKTLSIYLAYEPVGKLVFFTILLLGLVAVSKTWGLIWAILVFLLYAILMIIDWRRNRRIKKRAEKIEELMKPPAPDSPTALAHYAHQQLLEETKNEE